MKRSVKRSDQNGDFRCSFPLRVFPCVRRGVWFGHQIKTNWGRAVSFRLDLTNPSLRGQLGSTAPPPPPAPKGEGIRWTPPPLGGWECTDLLFAADVVVSLRLMLGFNRS